MQLSRIYFPGLNGLRFFAALAVIFTHVELMKKYLGFDHLWIDTGRRISSTALQHIIAGEFHWASPLFAEAGPLGVIFFFVLSGFLITYLLLAEKELKGSVAIGAFYMRRILRIWPLYFFIMLLGFFVLPHLPWFHAGEQTSRFHEHFNDSLLFYLLFLPNVAYSLYMAVPNIGQSWSIGVEEQFYLLWPLLMKFARKTLTAMLIFMVALFVLKALAIMLWAHHPALLKFLAMSKLECMALGGIGAWLLFQQHKLLTLIYSKPLQWIALLGIPALLYLTPAILQNGVHMAYAGAFLIIILNVSSNPRALLKLENGPMNFLGKISYGIYMYHLMVVVFVLHLAQYLWPGTEQLQWHQNLAVYLLSILLTVLVSYLSFRYLENWFIRRKKKVTRVISGDEAKLNGA
ncbi:MAG: acyltransferase [Flavobacteriales bacterium]|nr:acyltransferase [Flavobacteriales bacterium]